MRAGLGRLHAIPVARFLSMWPTSTKRRTSGFVAGIFLLSTVCSCSSQQAIENARSRGAAAGLNEGRSTGEAAGFEAAVKAAERASYEKRLNELRISGEFNRIFICSLGAMVIAFLLGFTVQYVLLYLLRKAGLYDIDRIILGKDATEVELTNLISTTAPLRVTY